MEQIKQIKLFESFAVRTYIMVFILGIVWAFFHWMTPGNTFLTARNLSNLMTQMSVTGIIAVGMLMVIISGHIDLSAGAVLGFAGGILAYLLTILNVGLPVAILIAIGVCVSIGMAHGFLIAYAKIPAFVVTLGGLLLWRGAVKWLLAGNTIPVSNDFFSGIANAHLPPAAGWAFAGVAMVFVILRALRSGNAAMSSDAGKARYGRVLLRVLLPIILIAGFIAIMNNWQGVPAPVLILLAVILAGAFITRSTVFGRYLYAVGGNPEAARLSGLNNRLIVLAVYGLLGGLVGIAAMIYAARVGSASPDAGSLKELDAIAACVIGGASLMGGRGTIFGACIGALIMASLDNGMSLLNVRDFMQDIIKGSILVAAVGVDAASRRTAE